MSTSEQLRLRALRLLTDRYTHDPRAVLWARKASGLEIPTAQQMQAMNMAGFTPRELSLGADPTIVRSAS